MIITQVHLGTIKGHSKVCSFATQHNVTDAVLRERAVGMLTAGMSTGAVAREFYVNFSTVTCLQRRFKEFGSTSNRPYNRRPRVTTSGPGLYGNCSAQNHKALQRVVRSAQRITGGKLPALQDTYTT